MWAILPKHFVASFISSRPLKQFQWNCLTPYKLVLVNTLNRYTQRDLALSGFTETRSSMESSWYFQVSSRIQLWIRRSINLVFRHLETSSVFNLLCMYQIAQWTKIEKKKLEFVDLYFKLYFWNFWYLCFSKNYFEKPAQWIKIEKSIWKLLTNKTYYVVISGFEFHLWFFFNFIYE